MIDIQKLIEELQKKLSNKQDYFTKKEKELELNSKQGRITSRDYEKGRQELRAVQEEIINLKAEIKVLAK